jgi:hypothetical protein
VQRAFNDETVSVDVPQFTHASVIHQLTHCTAVAARHASYHLRRAVSGVTAAVVPPEKLQVGIIAVRLHGLFAAEKVRELCMML